MEEEEGDKDGAQEEQKSLPLNLTQKINSVLLIRPPVPVPFLHSLPVVVVEGLVLRIGYEALMWVSILVDLSQTVERQNPGLFPGPDRGIITGWALRQHFSPHIK